MFTFITELYLQVADVYIDIVPTSPSPTHATLDTLTDVRWPEDPDEKSAINKHDVDIPDEDEFHAYFDTKSSQKAVRVRSTKNVSAPRIHLCPVCGKSFSSPSKLKRHSSIHNPSLVKLHVCKCGKSFIRADVYQRHMRSTCHFDDPTFGIEKVCSCGLTFKMNWYYKKHLSQSGHNPKTIISDAKSVDGSSKESRSGNQRELRSHLKPTQVENIVRAVQEFATKNDGDRQISNHDTGNDQGGVNKGVDMSVASHQKAVGGSFVCPTCGCLFRQRSKMRRHMQYIHNPSLVKKKLCICGKSFKYEDSFRRHIRNEGPDGHGTKAQTDQASPEAEEAALQ